MTDSTNRDRSARTARPAGEGQTEHEGSRRGSLDDIRETYAEQASTMARLRRLDRLLVGRYRRRLFGRATGRVLDVACGTGTNAEYVPETAEYVGVDVSPEMLREADAELRRLGRGGTLAEMDAQSLAVRDDSFETVISSLSTCTFPDPLAALGEMNRVCEPDGQVLLLEHGRSSVELLGRLQDWRADAHFEKHRCRWNQNPLALVSQSDLALRESSTKLLGVITAIRAEPG
ncbi:class I SAM-dependent methyltransferase [Halosimplex sp. TS25]|uniref:class I SAM-dependent methyltransferase n=1 Tax=Halosimplex rarum TaxID=3396619 RepID=UPI0039E942E9